ncbi:MAG: pilus assembly PilX N-terminal domain-containing protein [Gammaproteobacteria bacterium]|nr:pilus assembly PilX N-terminal domain-containing protein [Gammaproteobacteria bacterium]
MFQEEIFCNERGFVLMITLLFIFVLTLLAISGSQDIILENKMQNNMQQELAVFAYAELGMQQQVLQLQGESMTLPNSSISLKTTSKIIDTDSCDNQTIDIQSIAQNSISTVVLNSRAIFAKVPRDKGCKKIPAYRVVWWSE